MSVALTNGIVFNSVAAFESITTVPGDGGTSIYRPKRFVLNHKHQASSISLDALVAMLVPVVAAAPTSDGSLIDLDLTMASIAAVSQPGSPEEKCRRA